MPVKFDDLPKMASEVLNDDYQTKDVVFKAKQKTSLGGATLSTQVDIWQHDKTATPAKLTWKFPAVNGVQGLSVDKMEMDKNGKFKLEASADKLAYDGLKLEFKSDIVDRKKDTLGFTYYGAKNAQVKFEFKPAQLEDTVGEVTYTRGMATCGLKATPFGKKGPELDLGVRVLSGNVFGSLLVKNASGAIGLVKQASIMYKASPDFKCAAMYQHTNGKDIGNITVGGVYKGLYKVKVNQEQTLSVTAKHSLAKGFTVLGGGSYNLKKAKPSLGFQLSIE